VIVVVVNTKVSYFNLEEDLGQGKDESDVSYSEIYGPFASVKTMENLSIERSRVENTHREFDHVILHVSNAINWKSEKRP
jgi:hypothetical protein